MLAIQGYYDGVSIKPLEKIIAQPNQRIIITIMDEFIEPQANVHKKGVRGIFSSHAEQRFIENEKRAWESAAIDNYENP